MSKIKPIIFRITKDEIQSMFSKMQSDNLVNESSKLTDKQIKNA